MSGIEILGLIVAAIIIAAYHLADNWIDGLNDVKSQEAERQRIVNEAAEFELEKAKDAYYDQRNPQ